MKETIQKVVCAGCGWRSRRKTGRLVMCPKCGAFAAFEVRGRIC